MAFVNGRKATAGRITQSGHVFSEAMLFDTLRSSPITHAVVELVGPMAGQGLASTAHFMTAWGLIRGMLVGLEIPYTMVTPQVWKRDLGLTTEVEDPADRKAAQKAAAVAFVQKWYPGLQLIRKGCRTPDHNIAEAVCLAVYGAYKLGYAEVSPALQRYLRAL